ncbi:MAG: retroviral-like aspartic protease family protein [Gammaproteobacteria bacterium]
MRQIFKGVAGAVLLAGGSAVAGEFDSRVPMRDMGAATYYVDGEIQGVGKVDLMVDTGSGYTVINEQTLALLKPSNGAVYVKDLSGILADGSSMTVPVYRIAHLRIGEACTLSDVEVAVFPGGTRQILGLSALRRAAPFIFSLDPPQLVLSHCTVRADVAGGRGS